MCDCSKIKQWTEGHRNDKRFASMEELKIGDWCYLVKCQDCGQLWQVDVWDKYHRGLAIKYFSSVKEWERIPDKEIRKEAIIANHGGLSEKNASGLAARKKRLPI